MAAERRLVVARGRGQGKEVAEGIKGQKEKIKLKTTTILKTPSNQKRYHKTHAQKST